MTDSHQDTVFDNFAGQLVASGVRPNAPLIQLEGKMDATAYKNLAQINGLMPKISDVIIHETRVFNNPLDADFRKVSAPYGAGVEQASFVTGAANKKNEGGCIPRGSVDMVSQINVCNFAYDIDVDIKDREISMAVMNGDQLGSYVAEKLKTPLKTLSQMKYRAQVQLLSDVIDGTRSITSSDSSDGTGATVTYNPNITGYAGVIENSGVNLPPVELKKAPAFSSGADAVKICEKLEAAAADMQEETDEYNVLGVDTFIVGKPLLVMERKTLNALDNAWTTDGADKKIPTRTAREYLSRFADIREIGSFAALPTNSSYANKRLVATMIDKDALKDFVRFADMESDRCTKGRLTGYNYQGENTYAIYRGLNAYALLSGTTSS